MMASTNEEDPFLQVQQDVLSQLGSTRPLFASYLRIRSLSTKGTSPELASARAELEAALAALADDLADLEAAVGAAEAHPAHFGLAADEVARRRRLVLETGGEVDDMRDELARAVLPRAAAAAAVSDDDDDDAAADDDDYAALEHQQQAQMMREQDQHLDGVFHTVGNLRRQADDMGRELEEQHEMLELVDRTADRVGSGLSNGVQKLRHIVRRNEDRWSGYCIGLLIFVLVLLLFLLLIL